MEGDFKEKNMFLACIKGFTTGASLIMVIGAQNAFVLRQGLLRHHLFVTALLCSLIDAVLITCGVMGFGNMITHFPVAIEVTKYFAIIFLLFYGLLSLRSAFLAKSFEDQNGELLPSLGRTILLLLAFSLLNPSVYLDTVILLGSIASQQKVGEQLYFAMGAIAASFVWFFSITYGSHVLSPLLRSPKSWKVIDSLVALTMWVLAFSLIRSI
jgi:L-lysine exporter family protein LysE/ArgO